jgi:MFS transporter, DHA1 family, multidrug resistance protein
VLERDRGGLRRGQALRCGLSTSGGECQAEPVLDRQLAPSVGRPMPDSRLRAGVHPWVLVAVVFAFTCVVENLSWNQLSAFTPIYLAGIGVTPHAIPSWTAAMASLSWAIGLPLVPIWGVLADRYSRKAIIVRSAVLEGILFFGWALTTDVWAALAFRSLSGFVLGNTGVMLAIQSSVTPRHQIGTAIGVVTAGGSIGIAVGPLLGAGLIHVAGVRGMLSFDGFASFLMAAIVTLAIREPELPRRREESVTQAMAGAMSIVRTEPWIWALFAATFLALLGTWLVLPLLPIYIARQAAAVGLDTSGTIGIALTLLASAQAASAPFWGKLVDRFNAVRVLIVTAIAASTALAIGGLTHDVRMFAVVLVIFGATGGAAAITNMSLLARTVPEHRRGSVLALINVPMYVAGVVGPPLGALLFPRGQVVVFGIAAVVTLTPILIVLRLRARPLPEGGPSV